MKKDNPAGRLYAILEEAKQKADGVPAINAWSEIFGTDINSPALIFQGLADLNKLSIRVKEMIESIEGINTELFLKPFSKIDQVFTLRNLDTNWGNYKKLLDEITMFGLAHCSEELSKHNSESQISEDDLKELQNEIQSLIEKVLSSSIDEQLRILLLEKLEKLRYAIFNYRVFGNENLKKSLEEGVGAVIVNTELFEKEKNSDEVGAFTKFLAKCERIISVVTKLKGLSAPIANQLEQFINQNN